MKSPKPTLEFVPMRMHKSMVIRVLREHPEDMPKVAPTFPGTAEEFIAALEAHPGEWFVNGLLLSEGE